MSRAHRLPHGPSGPAVVPSPSSRKAETVAARFWYGATALLGSFGLSIQYILLLAAHPGEAAHRTLNFLSYFSILTVMAVTAASFVLAIGRGGLRDRVARPTPRTAISVWITVVAVVFHLLLAKLVHLSHWGWWGNLLLHGVVPALWLGGWVLFPPNGGIGQNQPLRWLGYPLAYAAWTLVHGEATGWFPYPFLNITEIGVVSVAGNVLLMAVFFVTLGFVYRWIDGQIARWRHSH